LPKQLVRIIFKFNLDTTSRRRDIDDGKYSHTRENKENGRRAETAAAGAGSHETLF
jgi:hypothetical protein